MRNIQHGTSVASPRIKTRLGAVFFKTHSRLYSSRSIYVKFVKALNTKSTETLLEFYFCSVARFV